MLTSLSTIPRRVSIGRFDATPSQATTDARSRRGSCHAAGHLAYMQERNRTHADGMEIFLPTLFTAPPQPHQQLGSRPFQSVHVGATAAIGLPWTPSHGMNCNPLPSSAAVII
jgi:hypothetical protein